MELLERFAHGDPEAFETLFRRHQGEVYGWILRMVRDTAAAEDLTVDTFWRLHKSCARFDPAREFGPWARRVASNVALDYLRKVRREVSLDESLAADSAPDPDLARTIREAFARLSPKLRAVARLALIEQLPQAEIAGALGISVSAVKTRAFRAVHLLRKDLEEQGVQP